MLLREAYELHDKLNPKIYNEDNTMKPEVLDKLLEIANEFLEYIELPLNVVDIEIVGSNASFNYNENSDLDLHIIVNNEVNYVDPNVLRELYNLKKGSFNDKYDLTIYDIPVELYIEDIKDSNATNGRYSILKNEWIKEPEPLHYDLPDISKEVLETENLIADTILSEDEQSIIDLINKLYMDRKLGLAYEGEMSLGNLIFKELRNNGMLQELKDKYYELKSNDLSI